METEIYNDMSINETQIAAARELIDITQRRLAKDMGISYSLMSQWESGLRPPATRMARLLDYFHGYGIEFINEPGRQGVIRRMNGYR